MIAQAEGLVFVQLACGLGPKQPQSILREFCFFVRRAAFMALDSHKISDGSRATGDLLSVSCQEFVPLRVAQC